MPSSNIPVVVLITDDDGNIETLKEIIPVAVNEDGEPLDDQPEPVIATFEDVAKAWAHVKANKADMKPGEYRPVRWYESRTLETQIVLK